MKVWLVRSIVVSLLVIAGCAGAPRREQARWEDDPQPTGQAEATDAGVDAADSDAAVVAPGLALFQRSCTPCHTRSGSTDSDAVRGGVYFETDADFRRWAASDTIGTMQSSLADILSLRADGLDLIVGRSRTPMPPRASAYPPLSPEEARTALTWLRAQR